MLYDTNKLCGVDCSTTVIMTVLYEQFKLRSSKLYDATNKIMEHLSRGSSQTNATYKIIPPLNKVMHKQDMRLIVQKLH